MGEVILGFPGPWAEDYSEKADHYTTKIGGLPDWPIPEASINPDLLKCILCGGKLFLIAQIYAPILLTERKIEERTIYILGCPKPKCGSNPSSWRALRIQKCQFQDEVQRGDSSMEPLSEENSSAALKSRNWLEEGLSMSGLGDHDDEDDSDVDLEALGEALFAASSMASQSKKQNSSLHVEAAKKGMVMKPRVNDASTAVLPCFYVYCQKAQCTTDITSVCANYSSLSIKENQSTPSDNEDGEMWEEETYEYDRALGADRAYLKFKKQIDASPDQCFRYSYGGNPLLATTDFRKPDTCRICSSLRHFEMQLMPPLLYFLNQAAVGSSAYSLEEWSWLTLIVYTCSNSCCPSSCKEKCGSCCWAVAEETIVIQDE